MTTHYRFRTLTNNTGYASHDPWHVLCDSHAKHRVITGEQHRTHEIEPLDGEWQCEQCARFDAAASMKLARALKAPGFSHTTRRGFYREIGCVYHNDPTSPSGVRSAGVGFDPFCEEAVALVEQITKRTPHDGPTRGPIAERRVSR